MKIVFKNFRGTKMTTNVSTNGVLTRYQMDKLKKIFFVDDFHCATIEGQMVGHRPAYCYDKDGVIFSSIEILFPSDLRIGAPLAIR